MSKHRALLRSVVTAIILSIAATPGWAEPPTEWQGLTRVNSERFDVAYLAPGANFAAYSKVMLDPTEAAFRRNWLRDYNDSVTRTADRISEDEARQMLQVAQTGFHDAIVEAYGRSGYQIVTAPGPDVLRIRTGVVNIEVNAPDRMTVGRSVSFAPQAGAAALIIEVRDSMSGALLGRAEDQRRIGEGGFNMRRTSLTNRSDFQRTFNNWAQRSAEALTELRQTPATNAPAS